MAVVKNFCDKMASFCQDKPLLKFAVAYSGGSDSLALVMLLHQWLKSKNAVMIAVTIDHMLRPESSVEAIKAGQILKLNNIEHQIIKWQGEKPKANIQAVARQARYKLLIEFCKKSRIDCLLTGHNANDQAENFLIRLEYGSQIYGLAGIYDIIDLPNLKIIRPLLEFSKQELQEYLKLNYFSWIEDPSNHNKNFVRVKYRNELAKNLDSADVALKLTNNIKSIKSSLDELVKSATNNIVRIFVQGLAMINLKALNILPQEVKFHIIYNSIRNIGDSSSIRGEKIARLVSDLEDYQKFIKQSLHGCILKVIKEELQVLREYQSIENKTLALTNNSNNIKEIYWDNRLVIYLEKKFFNFYPKSILSKIDKKEWSVLKKNLNKEQLKYGMDLILTLPCIRSLEKLIAIPHIKYYCDNEISNLISYDFVRVTNFSEIYKFQD